jgi:hypothetical protein
MSPTEWGLVLAALAIAVTISFYWRDQVGKRKKLVYDYEAIPVTQNGRDIFPGLDLTYRGHSVSGASIVILTVANTGRVPILKADFEEPLSFRFAGYTADEELLAQHITPIVPRDLPLRVHLSDGDGRRGVPTITVDPLLLNPGDRFSISILVSGFADKVTSTARIAGIPRVERQTNRPQVRLPMGINAAAAVIMGMLFYANSYVRTHFPPPPQPSVATPTHNLLAAILGGLFVFFLVYLAERIAVHVFNRS